MSAYLLFLWVVTGAAVATWLMMRVFWIKDPVPGVSRYIGTVVAGALGGLVGGAITHSLGPGASNPMPGIVGALAVSLIVSGGWAALGGGAGKATR